MKVLFWGSPQFAVAPLRKIAESGRHEIVAVVCQPDRGRGRGRKVQAPAVKIAAEELGFKVFQPERPRGDDFISEISALGADISVVVAYGHILLPQVLDVPRFGSVNIHASVLPAYRGAAPIQRAIQNGETTTGITVIRMDAGMDTGDIIALKEIPILDTDTSGTLAEKLSELGAELIVEVLDRAEQNSIEPKPQPADGISLAPKISRDEAVIDWSREATELSCFIRAFDPAPGAFSKWNGKVIKVFSPIVSSLKHKGQPGTVIHIGEGTINVACGAESVLEVREVQLEGKRRMSTAEFLKGARIGVGDRLE